MVGVEPGPRHAAIVIVVEVPLNRTDVALCLFPQHICGHLKGTLQLGFHNHFNTPLLHSTEAERSGHSGVFE